MNGVQVSGQNEEMQLVFGPQLDVAHTRNLYREFDNALAARKPLVLNGTDVERIDAATLQLLAAFCRAAHETGIAIRWLGASPVLLNAAAFLDLEGILGKPS